MTTPVPADPPPPAGKKPVLVVPGYTRRDVVLGIIIAVAVLGLIVFAIIKAGTERSPNLLRGVVAGRYQTGETETLLNVSRGGVKGKTADTGLYLKVRVPEQNRVYEVMVSEADWKRYKDGDTMDFLRPPGEQH